jgi:hypothetical protein
VWGLGKARNGGSDLCGSTGIDFCYSPVSHPTIPVTHFHIPLSQSPTIPVIPSSYPVSLSPTSTSHYPCYPFQLPSIPVTHFHIPLSLSPTSTSLRGLRIVLWDQRAEYFLRTIQRSKSTVTVLYSAHYWSSGTNFTSINSVSIIALYLQQAHRSAKFLFQ